MAWRATPAASMYNSRHGTPQISAEGRAGGRGSDRRIQRRRDRPDNPTGPARLARPTRPTRPHDADHDRRRRGHRPRRGAGDRRKPAQRLRLHGRCAQVARLRVRRRQSGIELPRTSRVDHQLRRQPRARDDHVHARGIGGRDGARLLQGRGQADARRRARHRRPAARVDGALQRVVRSRACLHGDRQLQRRGSEAPGGVVPRRAGRGAHGPRLHEMGRHTLVADALRGVGGARL